ncbi:MAG: hypothetical protein KAQ97_10520 [Candidatus Fermentibacteraceae bacterium]|nr:hypothetical protein [Candidatus Fermentibacteraceae bacterium]
MNRDIRRCTKCILPGNYPDVDFDSRGVCRVCREFDLRFRNIDWRSREKKLERMLDRYRGKGRSKYDCLVPYSGGKDSTYSLWLLKTKYGMNPLAFNIDNGFADKGAQLFIKKCTDRLGIDLYTYSPSKEFLNRVYAHAMSKAGEFCTACVVLIPTAIFRTADIHGIRLIAGGFSEMTEAPPPEYANMDRVRFWNIMKSGFSRKELEWDFFFPSWKRMFRIKYFNLPDYIKWELPEIYAILGKELGFEKKISDIRYDCLATSHSNFLFRRIAGFSKMEFLYANMVRAGYLNRQEAIKMLEEREPDGVPEGFFDFMNGIGCDCSILEETEGRSTFDFASRGKMIRELAIRIRKMLP